MPRPNRMQLWITATALILIAGAICIWQLAAPGEDAPAPLAGSDDRPKAAASGDTEDDKPEMQFSGTRIVGRSQGIKQFELEIASFSLADEEGSKVCFTGLTSGTFYEDGQPYAKVKAAKGIWDKATNNLELTGDIEVFAKGERILSARTLTYRGAEDILVSSQPVSFDVRGLQATARGMQADLRKDTIELQGGVDATLADGSRIRADRIIYNSEEEIMRIIGEAEIDLAVGSGRRN